MRVRPATVEDIPELAEIAERSYRAAFAGILEQDILAGRDAGFFAERFTASWQHMLVAVSQDKPAGFLLVTAGHIDMLFMEPHAIGQGGGALLLDSAEKLGARSLECFRDNYRARRFYEQHGWRIEREYEREFAGRSHRFVLYVKPQAGSA